jgi:hypothetical protein
MGKERHVWIASWLIFAACAAESHTPPGVELRPRADGDDTGDGSNQVGMRAGAGPASASPAGMGGMAGASAVDAPTVPGDRPRDFDPSGRWTSSGFEDPFEAELVVNPDGSISGRVCSVQPSGSAALPENCGPLAAAWTADNLIHFDFELPWTGVLPNGVRYQFVGAPGASLDEFTGVLMIAGATFPITFKRCPPDRASCS